MPLPGNPGHTTRIQFADILCWRMLRELYLTDSVQCPSTTLGACTGDGGRIPLALAHILLCPSLDNFLVTPMGLRSLLAAAVVVHYSTSLKRRKIIILMLLRGKLPGDAHMVVLVCSYSICDSSVDHGRGWREISKIYDCTWPHCLLFGLKLYHRRYT